MKLTNLSQFVKGFFLVKYPIISYSLEESKLNTMKKVKWFFFGIWTLLSCTWDMFIVSIARAKSEAVWEKYEAPPASEQP